MNLTPKQEEIRKEAAMRMQDNDWYKGVCLDQFPTDAQIDLNREAAVDFVCMRTCVRDNSMIQVFAPQQGYTLTELIIAIVLGLVGVTALFLLYALVHFIIKHW